ncbi:ribosomal protein S12 methylthiotransferase [Desulfitispora alkaliphila]|uniref:30S ribosomal protein S12 methylthiotransferase RimO n=1 Tax=Desulfitispora alkaliphila TaxID=622674 RepID=UPI003D195258
MAVKIYVETLGCAKNTVDSEVLLGIVDNAGYKIVDDQAEAEIIIINTCGFIEKAREESINTILELAQNKEEGNCKALIVMGCLVQKFKAELEGELPEVDGWLGTNEIPNILDVIKDTYGGKKTVIVQDNYQYIYNHEQPRMRTTPKYTAYVKIAEGCDNCCSYCTIPQMRGPYRSRRIESVVAEVKELAASGTKEINLIAQDLTMYGADIYNKLMLTELLRELVKIEEVKWIRLLYCYPTYFTDELIEFIADNQKICNYLDIPLQHAHNDILKSMNRKSSQSDVVLLLGKLKTQIPDVALRTTFILGFPGETEEHFNKLLGFISEHQFNWVGFFTYSQEDDTVAGKMNEQLAEEIKTERYEKAMEIQANITEQLNGKYKGKVLEVLVEGTSTESDEFYFGRTQYQAPEVDGKIYFTTPQNTNRLDPGEIVKVRINHVDKYDLIGELIP